jgi:hypothetical protein
MLATRKRTEASMARIAAASPVPGGTILRAHPSTNMMS